ncbi:hypothetical protein [Salicibibacter kimchii]|uniref:Uncharacterized protein n=1 Tax=Salicibibacter kimchii TaxID=2099786 RepID=A0A345BYR2_9BACI|nr:hypothetical protein [Salicibibacter kimchii]AXF56093.1 hypothetical protein DT065_08690 [Salicibibacter kimchii]
MSSFIVIVFLMIVVINALPLVGSFAGCNSRFIWRMATRYSDSEWSNEEAAAILTEILETGTADIEGIEFFGQKGDSTAFVLNQASMQQPMTAMLWSW